MFLTVPRTQNIDDAVVVMTPSGILNDDVEDPTDSCRHKTLAS